jgi:glyceraldehyde-3-phosphate dehydrogenase (NADP+)
MAGEFRILIGGSWVTTDKELEVINPYDGNLAGVTYIAGPDELEEALKSSVEAFETIRAMPAYQRSAVLAKVVQGLKDRAEELARTISKEAGKPITDARGEVARAVNTFQIASEEAKRLTGELLPLDIMAGSEKRIGIVRRFPLGPVLGITPFNFPLNLVAHKVAPAMACANPIIIKPASKTPLTALKLGEIVTDAGWPPGGLNVCPCPGTAAEKLVADERIKKLTFTGSAPVGWKLKQKAAEKKVTLELGGNAGVVVHEDADIEFAAKRCTVGAFSYAGQICISVQRIYVQRNVFEMFKERYIENVKTLKMGDPLDESTEVGPMIDTDAPKRTEQWVKSAVKDGAKVLTGGKRKGNFFEPTVLTGTKPRMKVCGEEVFAPVVTVEPYDGFEDALKEVNRSRFGLQAGVFTKDLTRVFKAFEELEVGGVIVNDVPTYRVDNMPYGGVKMSGFGREGIRYAIEEMTEPRLLALKYGS